MPPRFVPEDGLELIRRFAPAQVIVLTGHADHALALRAAALGAWDFLAKPADPEMLGFVVGRAYARRRSRPNCGRCGRGKAARMAVHRR